MARYTRIVESSPETEEVDGTVQETYTQWSCCPISERQVAYSPLAYYTTATDRARKPGASNGIGAMVFAAWAS
jgi:hypothetical protein